MLSSSQFATLHGKVTGKDGGFTVDTKTGEYPDSGIMVSLPGHEETAPTTKTTPDSIRDYASRKASELGKPGNYMGGWRAQTNQGDDVYLDVNTRFDNQVDARRATMDRNQIGNFDLGSFKETINPFHPLSGTADPQFGGIGPDTPENREWWATAPKRTQSRTKRRNGLLGPGPDFQ